VAPATHGFPFGAAQAPVGRAQLARQRHPRRLRGLELHRGHQRRGPGPRPAAASQPARCAGRAKKSRSRRAGFLRLPSDRTGAAALFIMTGFLIQSLPPRPTAQAASRPVGSKAKKRVSASTVRPAPRSRPRPSYLQVLRRRATPSSKLIAVTTPLAATASCVPVFAHQRDHGAAADEQAIAMGVVLMDELPGRSRPHAAGCARRQRLHRGRYRGRHAAGEPCSARRSGSASASPRRWAAGRPRRPETNARTVVGGARGDKFPQVGPPPRHRASRHRRSAHRRSGPGSGPARGGQGREQGGVDRDDRLGQAWRCPGGTRSAGSPPSGACASRPAGRRARPSAPTRSCSRRPSAAARLRRFPRRRRGLPRLRRVRRLRRVNRRSSPSQRQPRRRAVLFDGSDTIDLLQRGVAGTWPRSSAASRSPTKPVSRASALICEIGARPRPARSRIRSLIASVSAIARRPLYPVPRQCVQPRPRRKGARCRRRGLSTPERASRVGRRPGRYGRGAARTVQSHQALGQDAVQRRHEAVAVHAHVGEAPHHVEHVCSRAPW